MKAKTVTRGFDEELKPTKDTSMVNGIKEIAVVITNNTIPNNAG